MAAAHRPLRVSVWWTWLVVAAVAAALTVAFAQPYGTLNQATYLLDPLHRAMPELFRRDWFVAETPPLPAGLRLAGAVAVCRRPRGAGCVAGGELRRDVRDVRGAVAATAALAAGPRGFVGFVAS